MEYLLTFLEGIITFVSPCLLPMIPIYVMYFAGAGQGAGTARGKTLARALCFVLGFTVVFVALGAFAGTVGGLLVRHQTAVNVVAGALLIAFGLSYLGLFNLPFLKGHTGGRGVQITGLFSAFVFGVVFSVSWTPCVGTFLGAALMQASARGSVLHGVLMLLSYSAGLGIPFVLSAVLIGRLETAFDFIKRHFVLINRIAGIFLIAMGVLMATGLLGRWLALLSFAA